MTPLARAEKLREEEKRAAQQARDTVIRGIMTSMCAGLWMTGPSHRELADKHGVEIGTVRGWASEAAMVLRICRGSDEEIRDEIIAGIQHCQKIALEDRDAKAALAAFELRAKVFGLLVKKTEDVTAPREQLWEKVRGWLEHPTPELEKMLAETGWVRR